MRNVHRAIVWVLGIGLVLFFGVALYISLDLTEGRTDMSHVAPSLAVDGNSGQAGETVASQKGGRIGLPYAGPPLAFDGNSIQAGETVIVPTLDTPAPAGKNIIWCATFQLCWDELKPIVAIDPDDVPDSPETVERLNNARVNKDDLPAGGYYVAAGRVKDGIVRKIQSDMAARFPHVTPDIAADDATVALAYAYLADSLKFGAPYLDSKSGDVFVDSAGTRTPITSFGLHKRDGAPLNTMLVRQIEILYFRYNEETHRYEEFVLDLDKKSSPTQIILACVAPRESLVATWQDVLRKIEEWQPGRDSEREFDKHDTLAVPNINYKIQHRFRELETNPRLKASQTIEFRLDRSGTAFASHAQHVALAADGRDFQFTQPFLIVMRKRESTEPYFVMWIDNAELLCKP